MGVHYETGIYPEIFEWMRVGERRATDVGVGTNGAVWIVGVDERPGGYGVARWTGLGWQSFDTGAVTVEPAPRGEAWLITDRGDLLEPVEDGWQICPTPAPVRDVTFGPLDDGVWIVTALHEDKPGQVLRRVGADWVEGYSHATPVPWQWDVPGVNHDDENNNDPYEGAGPRQPMAIAAMADGLPFVVDEDGAVYRKAVGVDGWLVIPQEPASDIAVSPDGVVWIVGRDERAGGHGPFRYYHGTDWHACEGAVTRIAVGPDGLPWAVDEAGVLYRHHVKL